MHISEGVLPVGWAVVWYSVSVPFLVAGLSEIQRKKKANPMYVVLTSIAGSAVFVFSLFPVPIPIVGTCSHPAGTGLSTLLLGPFVSIVVAFSALLIQALFLAHGGISTLGANTVAMGIVGSFSAFLFYKLARGLKLPIFVSALIAGAAADIFTYLTTSVILALALHGTTPVSTVAGSIFIAFLPTQIPLAVLEGLVIAGIIVYVKKNRPDILENTGIVR
ncbi:MAG: energy-coupling factor ABC transporter permease [Elusimicrobiota bacterium]